MIAVCLLMFSSCNHKAKVTHTEAAVEWDETDYDYDEFSREDADQKHTFTFHNVGPEPIVIHEIETTCSCVSADYTKSPVQPGDEGTVTVIFHPDKANIGQFDKTLNIFLNTASGVEKLHIQGFVNP